MPLRSGPRRRPPARPGGAAAAAARAAALSAGVMLATVLPVAEATTPSSPAAGLGAWSAPGPAQGLIVRLKDAPSHHELRQDVPQRRHALRWQGVLGDAALGGRSGRREPLLRAVGRDQQWLDFGRSLAPDESARLAERLRRDPRVDWVAPNLMEQRLQLTGDPLAPQQWWLQTVGGSNTGARADRRRGVPGFLAAWQSGVAGAAGLPGAVVAVLDTGITPHPDLQGAVLPGHDFVSEMPFSADGDGRDADPADPGDGLTSAELADSRFAGCALAHSTWHGTVISGLLAAVSGNGIGVAGINAQGRVLPVRVAGKCGATVVDIVDGMRWAGGLAVAGAPINPHPARILNISFGGSAACGPAYQSAIDELHAHGVVLVAAAGNGRGAVSRPASCRGVLGVTALHRDGFKAHYANFGSELAASGLATVGGDDSAGAWGLLLADGGLLTVWNRGNPSPGEADYAALYGTSFSAPLAAGTLSLMLSVNPQLRADQLLAGVRLAARPHVLSPRLAACSADNPGRCLCSSQSCGAGILDAEQALRYAAQPDSYVPPVRQPAVIDSPELAQAVALGPDMPGGVVTPPTTGGGGSGSSGGGGGGGGAASVAWVLGVALAALALALRRISSPAARRA